MLWEKRDIRKDDFMFKKQGHGFKEILRIKQAWINISAVLLRCIIYREGNEKWILVCRYKCDWETIRIYYLCICRQEIHLYFINIM